MACSTSSSSTVSSTVFRIPDVRHHSNDTPAQYGTNNGAQQVTVFSPTSGERGGTLFLGGEKMQLQQRLHKLQVDLRATNDTEKKFLILSNIREIERRIFNIERASQREELEQLSAVHAKLKKKHTKVANQADRAIKVVNELYFHGRTGNNFPLAIIPQSELEYYKMLEMDYAELELDYNELEEEKDDLEGANLLLHAENRSLRGEMNRLQTVLDQTSTKRKNDEVGDCKQPRSKKSCHAEYDIEISTSANDVPEIPADKF